MQGSAGPSALGTSVYRRHHLEHEPFYLSAPEALVISTMPAPMRECLAVTQGGSPDIEPAGWDPRGAPSLTEAISCLLDYLGTMLRKEHLFLSPPSWAAGPPEELPGREAFKRPPGQHSMVDRPTGTLGCMLPDGTLFARHRQRAPDDPLKFAYIDNNGYLKVKLGKRHPPANAIAAHTIVLWAMWGGPPPTLVSPVVMHLCRQVKRGIGQGRPLKCICVDHLVYGTQHENMNTSSELEICLLRLHEQNRSSTYHIGTEGAIARVILGPANNRLVRID
jgi:hypothetical protein